MATPLTPYPARYYEDGVGVLLSPWRQSKHDITAGPQDPRLHAAPARPAAAQQASLLEALWFTTDNLLAEGCISNVFLVKGGTIKTPPVETPILPGVTRATVIEVAKAASIPLEERPLTINDVLEADEVFLTSTSMEVMPVCRIERHAIADDKPGPISKQLLQLFRELAQKECPPQDCAESVGSLAPGMVLAVARSASTGPGTSCGLMLHGRTGLRRTVSVQGNGDCHDRRCRANPQPPRPAGACGSLGQRRPAGRRPQRPVPRRAAVHRPFARCP